MFFDDARKITLLRRIKQNNNCAFNRRFFSMFQTRLRQYGYLTVKHRMFRTRSLGFFFLYNRHFYIHERNILLDALWIKKEKKQVRLQQEHTLRCKNRSCLSEKMKITFNADPVPHNSVIVIFNGMRFPY